VGYGQKQTGIDDRWRFPGQFSRQETGLFDNYFRDYGPESGRYTTTDLIGLRGGLNTYEYSESNPIMFRDEVGLYATVCCRNIQAETDFLGISISVETWFRHCYIRSDKGRTYSLFPDPDLGRGVPEIDDPRDTEHSQNESCGLCLPKTSCGDQEECFQRAHRNYPVGDYRYRGPNSNTYAGTLARSCCKHGVPQNIGNGWAPGLWDNPPLGPRRGSGEFGI
jgi:RHS repeat-associated protein